MRRGAWVLAAVAAGGAGWAAAELAQPRPTDIRVFDPDEVARLETAMWRSRRSLAPGGAARASIS